MRDAISASLYAQVSDNAVIAAKLEDLVVARAEQRRFGSAMAWAEIAARFITVNPTGRLRSPRMERALDSVATQALGTRLAVLPRAGGRRVLHVLSEADRIGGHVQMAVRWIHLDPDSISDVVVTRSGHDLPALREAAASRQGTVTGLGALPLLAAARQLRALAAAADVVVCHTHHDDPVPTVAFGGAYRGAPVITVNHADHVFWLGTGNVSIVANLRDVGAQAAEVARGFPPTAMFLLPTPLDVAGRATPRDQAKDGLGIPREMTVALTLAREPKYRPAAHHPGFVDVVEPVLAGRDDVLLLAVGPSLADPHWARLAQRLPERVRVMGPQREPGKYLDAADIYLDSFPFSSITSMLEAAIRDVPVLTSSRYEGLHRLLGSSGPLDDVVFAATTTEDYRATLTHLLEHPDLRRARGLATGKATRDRHGPDGWPAHLAALYAAAAAAEPVLGRGSDGEPSAELIDYACVLLATEARSPLLWSVLTTADQLDRRDRLEVAARSTATRVVDRLRHAAGHPRKTSTALLLPWTGHPVVHPAAAPSPDERGEASDG